MTAMRSATSTTRRRTPPTQAALFPELSGGNEGAGGSVELLAEVTASPAGIAVAGDSLGLAISDLSVMVFDHSQNEPAALCPIAILPSRLPFDADLPPGAWDELRVGA